MNLKLHPVSLWIGLVFIVLASAIPLSAQHVITMTTSKAIGEKISLRIVANGEVFIEGALVASAGNESVDYFLTAQTITIRGDVVLLHCSKNQLTSLDVSKNTVLTELQCSKNQLTNLDVSKNTALTALHCFSNRIKGEAMTALVNSLSKAKYSQGEDDGFHVINSQKTNEGNICTEADAAVAKAKGWIVYDHNGGSPRSI